MSPKAKKPQESYQSTMERGKQVRDEGNVANALQIFERAASLASNDGEKAEALCMMGRCHGAMGDFGSAEIALNDALRLAAKTPLILARVKLQVGTVRSLQGQLDSAKQFLSQAANELKQHGDQSMRQRALGNLGLVLLGRGEYQEAISAYKSALEVAESLNDWFLVGIDLDNMGECYQDLGDLETARQLHERALSVAREHDTGPYAQIDATRNLGVDLLRLGELDQAMDAINQALDMARTYNQKDLVLQSMISLGELYLAQGKCDKAEALAQKLVEESAGVPMRLAATRLLLGQCLLARNDSMRAMALLEAGVIDAQASYSKIWILRLHAALSQIVSHPAIADVHRRIAAELVQQIADSLHDKALRLKFEQSPLARSVI